MQRDRRVGLEQLTVDGTEHTHVVVGACGAAHDGIVLVDGLEELAYDEGDRLDPLHLFLSIKVLGAKVLQLVADVVFLDLGGGWGGRGGKGTRERE